MLSSAAAWPGLPNYTKNYILLRMPATPKPIEFVGDSLDGLRGFPQGARREAGYQLHCVQRGVDPYDWKPMPTIGAGVKEIRITDSAGAFRVIYIAKFADAIYVLRCFQKKTAKTAQRDIDLAAARLK